MIYLSNSKIMTEQEAIKWLEDYFDRCLVSFGFKKDLKQPFVEFMKNEKEAVQTTWERFINIKFSALAGQVRPIRNKPQK
jgi:hypothetical protein